MPIMYALNRLVPFVAAVMAVAPAYAQPALLERHEEIYKMLVRETEEKLSVLAAKREAVFSEFQALSRQLSGKDRRGLEEVGRYLSEPPGNKCRPHADKMLKEHQAVAAKIKKFPPHLDMGKAEQIVLGEYNRIKELGRKFVVCTLVEEIYLDGYIKKLKETAAE